MGFDRILEALEANMWENMEYKTDKRPVNPPIVSVSETTAPRVRGKVFLQFNDRKIVTNVRRDSSVRSYNRRGHR